MTKTGEKDCWQIMLEKQGKKNPLKNKLVFVCSTQIHQVLGYVTFQSCPCSESWREPVWIIPSVDFRAVPWEGLLLPYVKSLFRGAAWPFLVSPLLNWFAFPLRAEKNCQSPDPSVALWKKSFFPLGQTGVLCYLPSSPKPSLVLELCSSVLQPQRELQCVTNGRALHFVLCLCISFCLKSEKPERHRTVPMALLWTSPALVGVGRQNPVLEVLFDL